MKGILYITSAAAAATVLIRSTSSGRDRGHQTAEEGQALPFSVADDDLIVISSTDGPVSGRVEVSDGVEFGVHVVQRERATGRDVDLPALIEAGGSQSFEATEDADVVITGETLTGRTADVGELGAASSPEDAAKIADAKVAKGEGDAGDDDVRSAIDDLKGEKANLNKDGTVKLAKLNAALADKGFNPITADRSAALHAE